MRKSIPVRLVRGHVTVNGKTTSRVFNTYDGRADPNLAPANFTYDAHGRLESVAAGTRQTLFAYNARHELESIHDSLDRVTRFERVGGGTAKEPLGFSGGSANFYSYAFGDPVNYFDPNGLQVAAANHPDEVGSPPRTFVADLNDPALLPLVTPPYHGASKFYGESQECVAFTKHFGGLPCSDCWRAGMPVMGNNIKPGTAIATFDSRGRYPQDDVNKNSGIFLFKSQGGFSILDQWHDHKAEARPLYPGPSNPSNNADAYSVITVPRGTKSSNCACGN